MRGWTSWDTRCATRAAAIALAALGLAWVVTAASDEGGLAWGERAGRALPFAPVCAAVGAWLALAPARARGDERALAALGRSRWERRAAAVVGGAAVSLVASLLLTAPVIDVRGFYPRPEAHVEWRAEAGSPSNAGPSFASSDGRWRIGADGAPVAIPLPPSTEPAPIAPASSAPTRLPRLARFAAAVATAVLGVALPLLVTAARRRSAGRVAMGALATALAMVFAFQSAAAARTTPLLALVPPLLLLAAAASLYATDRTWRIAKSPK